MMLDYFIYRQTPAGRVNSKDKADFSGELLGVVSFTPGIFEVKVKGEMPKIGDSLLLPVKSSKQLSLQLVVNSVDPLITPIGSWSAGCTGPDQPNFNVKFANITCDRCGDQVELEFIEYSDDTQADALAGMNKQGWKATEDEQICPNCTQKKE